VEATGSPDDSALTLLYVSKIYVPTKFFPAFATDSHDKSLFLEGGNRLARVGIRDRDAVILNKPIQYLWLHESEI